MRSSGTNEQAFIIDKRIENNRRASITGIGEHYLLNHNTNNDNNSNNDLNGVDVKEISSSDTNSAKIHSEHELLLNQLSSSSQNSLQTSIKSLSDNNNKNLKILFANPAYYRFFNPPTLNLMQQPAKSYKQIDDKLQTTQYSNNNYYDNIINNEAFNSSSSLVQGSLNKNCLINNEIVENGVSVAAKILTESEETEENHNNYSIDYSNKTNPIGSVKEFSRFFSNQTNNTSSNNKNIHNSIINRNLKKIDNKNYNSRRSSNNNNYYYSATESLGEESDYPSEFESSSIISSSSNIIIRNNHNNINNYNNKKINGYHHYFSNNNNNNNTNSTNRIKQLKQFQLNNNKSLQEIHLKQQQQQEKKKSQNKALPITVASVILNSNEIEDKTCLNNNNNNKRISYASITLRQPLKDINYFSDTEGLKTASSFNSNRNRLKHSLITSNNNSTSNLINNNFNNKPEQLNRKLSSSVVVSNRNINNNYNNNNTNNNTNRRSSKVENSSQIVDSFSRFYQPTKVTSHPTMVSMASSSYMNKQQGQAPQSYSRMSNAPLNMNKPTGYISQDQEQDYMGSMQRNYNYSSMPAQQTNQSHQQKWFPSHQPAPAFPAQHQVYNPYPTQYPNQYHDMQGYEDEEVYDDHVQRRVQSESPPIDPVQERYERELGSALAKPTSAKPNYSDSFFYNSSVFNYPTIDDQKKLAKSIACSLEGADPATSKFHKKKPVLNKFGRDGYESESAIQSPGFDYQHGGGVEYSYLNPDEIGVDQSYIYDDSLPDVIKRSIAQANMVDPIRLVHAPESFKQQHYTEHVSHTQMPPKAALNLAHELEAEQRKGGGRGAALFQKRKARSEKWVVEEGKKDVVVPTQKQTNQNQQYQQHYQQEAEQRQERQYQQQQQIEEVQPQLSSHYVLPTVQNTNILNSKFSTNFNARPRGWGNSGDRDLKTPVNIQQNKQQDYALYEQQQQQQQAFDNESYTSTALLQPVESATPVPFELNQNSWNQQNRANQFVSQEGVYNIKSKLNNQQSSVYNQYDVQQQQQQQQSQVSKVKLNKLSSHENYLFNNRNAVQVINNNTNQNYGTGETNVSYHVREQLADNSNFYHYDESIAASDL